MKKWMCCVLVGVLLLCCTACDREPVSSVHSGADAFTTTTNDLQNTTTTTTTQITSSETTSQYELRTTTGVVNKTDSSQSAHVSLTTTSSSAASVTSSIQGKQYISHDKTQKYEWKCDIVPAKIKVYTGSPLEGFFITVEDVLYEYNSKIVFPETEKHYRKIKTDLKFIYIYYHFQLDKLSVLTDDFKTYTYNKEEKSFVNIDNDFGSVVKEFNERGKILSWANNLNSTTFWFMDKKGNIYTVNQKQGIEYTQSLICTMSLNEKILSSFSGVIKTESGYYCFDSKKSCFALREEPTSAYDNIAFLNDFIVMYKNDPTHIYDHKLVYNVKFSY